MNRRSQILFCALCVCLVPESIKSQGLEYRYSLVSEGEYAKLNSGTPINYQNTILPQPDRSAIGISNLFLSKDGISTLLNISLSTDNLHKPDYAYALRECAWDYSLSDNIDLTLGKKILKWGTGYAFNPTGVVEPQRSPSDPSDRFGQNEGSKLIAANYFSGKTSFTLVYVNDCTVDSWIWHWGSRELAARAYAFLSGLDLSLVAHYREGDRLELGSNWSYVIGNNLEIHGEFLGKQGSSSLYHQSISTDDDPQILFSNPYSALYEHSSRIFYKFL